MKKAILFLLFLPLYAYAYTGQSGTNVSIMISDDLVTIYNIHFNHTINITNQSTAFYEWDVPYEYNFSSQNITIIQYNQSCDYDLVCNEESISEIKAKIDAMASNQSRCDYGDTQKYYELYRECFTNSTICNEYRKSNEQFQNQYESCSKIKDTYFQQVTMQEADYHSLNSTYSSCKVMASNYSVQRIIWAFLTGLAAFGLSYYFLKVHPSKQKVGRFTTRHNISPDTNTINPDNVHQKHPITNRKSKEPINPDEVM